MFILHAEFSVALTLMCRFSNFFRFWEIWTPKTKTYYIYTSDNLFKTYVIYFYFRKYIHYPQTFIRYPQTPLYASFHFTIHYDQIIIRYPQIPWQK